MGGNNSKKRGSLKESEVREFAKVSNFSEEEILNLHRFYKYFSATNKDDGVIDYSEFCEALSIPHSEVTRRIFLLFDTNGDKFINFREFIVGIGNFLYESQEDKIKLSFKLLDIKGHGVCPKNEVISILQNSVSNMDGFCIPDSVIEEMVNEQYKALTGNSTCDQITFEQYRKMLFKNKGMLKWLTLDIQKLSKGAELLTKKLKNRKKTNLFCGK